MAFPVCSIVFTGRNEEATLIINLAHQGHARNNNVPDVSPGL
jgi:hypothetical protein